jgi:hypothetical protein
MKTKNVKYTQRLKNLNKKITTNDEVYKIKEFVKGIDLSRLQNHLSVSGRGQHPYPLWMPVAIWMHAYSQGILEYRKVGRLCRTEDTFYWLSCGFEPSDAYFEQWKLRILPLMPRLLESYQIYLLGNDLLSQDLFGLDGFKLECWASVRQNKTHKQIDKEKEKIEDKLEDNDLSDQAKARLLRRSRKLENRKEELFERKALSDKSDKEKEGMRINISSPDTVILHRRDGKLIQGVNVQSIVNGDQIITTHSVERKSTDNGLLLKMVKKLSLFLNVIILEIYLLVDSGYWNKQDIEELDPSKGYKIIMPSPLEVAASRKKNYRIHTKGSLRNKEGFTYDETLDKVICPKKKYLYPQGKSSNYGKHYRRVFQAHKRDCENCKDKENCLGPIKGKSKRITLPIESQAVKNMIDFYYQEKHKELYKKRSVLNEPVNSQLVNNRGIAKLHCYDGKCIDGEVALLILIHTMKKIENLYGTFLPRPMKKKLILIFLFAFYVNALINKNRVYC